MCGLSSHRSRNNSSSGRAQGLIMGRSLVWFRNDLRVHDHEPLTRACAEARDQGDEVLCLYVVDPHWFGKTRSGFDRMSPFRAAFLRESLVDLDHSLREVGGKLLIAAGVTDVVISEVTRDLSIDTVFFSHEYGPEEKWIERRVCKILQDRGTKFRRSSPNTLLAEEDLPFSLADLPDVFSKFRRKVESDFEVRPTNPTPSEIPCSLNTQQSNTVFELSDPRFNSIELLTPSTPSKAARWAIEFSGGESAALARMNDYFFTKDCLRVYKETRNGMLGADYSSKLSPWLAHGCVSPRRVYELVQEYESVRVKNDSTYWLIFELLWRDYFAFVLAKYGREMFLVGGLRQLELPWKTDRKRFDAWCQGRTGFPLIDANMRELAASGFMSNRGRQNVASFLTKNLGIDWRLGAEWFESQLIDYDPASN